MNLTLPGAALLALSSLACQPVVSPVTLVATRTPGVAYVIVRPDVSSRSSREANPRSRYFLLCDGRPADGMHCEIPTEAALTRSSFHPRTGKAAAALEGPVGSVPDHSYRPEEPGEQGAPPAPSQAAPPPVVIVPIPSVSSSDAHKGGSK